MPAVKLTKRSVEAQKPSDRDVILWDTELKGFACKVTPAGRRVYFLYYRLNGKTQRRPTIGVHGAITVDKARSIARQWLADVAEGGDPSRERKSESDSPTVKDLCKRFLAEYSSVHNKPGTYKNYQRQIEGHILPALGRQKVHEVTRDDVAGLHARLRETPYQANRLLSLVSKMMNLAEQWGYRPNGSNPTRHVKKYRERSRERYLTAEELARLSAVLHRFEVEGAETPSVIAAIRLLIATGCRLSEILTLRWEWVDLERQCLRLPDSKTGAKVIPLNSLTLDILASIERVDDNSYVVTGRRPGTHLVNMQKPWRRIRHEAGLDDLRLHDLRHSFASVAAGLGEGLNVIGKLLGHTQAQTTHRYAHLADDPVRQATERVGQTLSKIMERK